jgi:uncharacterized protein YjbJ (UPF0337 family)
MDPDKIYTRWDWIRDEMRTRWDDLTDDELDNVDGDVEKLYGLMREKYGKSRDETDAYLDQLSDDTLE